MSEITEYDPLRNHWISLSRYDQHFKHLHLRAIVLIILNTILYFASPATLGIVGGIMSGKKGLFYLYAFIGLLMLIICSFAMYKLIRVFQPNIPYDTIPRIVSPNYFLGQLSGTIDNPQDQEETLNKHKETIVDDVPNHLYCLAQNIKTR